MNFEEMYMVFKGASFSAGAKLEIIQKWFEICGIIDGRLLTSSLFLRAYERIEPNFGELSLSQFIILLGVIGRETKTDLKVFLDKFSTVKDDIVKEIQDSYK